MTSTHDPSHGHLLTEFLQREWDALYLSRGAWCRRAGLADSTVLRWSAGVEPDLKNLQLVADGLNRKLIEVLHAAGYIDDADMRIRTVAAPRDRLDLADAIRTDSTLDKPARDAMIGLLKVLRAQTAKSSGRRRTVHVPKK